MKQLLLSLCLSLAAISGSAQNAAAIEQKLIEYGRMFTTKQNIYYFIGDDGKVTDVVMSSTIDYDMQQDITEFFKSLPPFSGGAGKDMVTIMPSTASEKSTGYVSQNLSGTGEGGIGSYVVEGGVGDPHSVQLLLHPAVHSFRECTLQIRQRRQRITGVTRRKPPHHRKQCQAKRKQDQKFFAHNRISVLSSARHPSPGGAFSGWRCGS